MMSEDSAGLPAGEIEMYGNLSVSIGIVIADFYSEISERLLGGAVEVLNAHPKVSYETFRVSGAWELPVITKSLMQSSRFHGMIAIGCVIRGETDHYEYICQQAASGLMAVSLEYTLPVGLALLTVGSEEQALARSLQKNRPHCNKGAEAAEAVLRSIYCHAEIRQES